MNPEKLTKQLLKKKEKKPALSFVDRLFALVMADERQFVVDDIEAGTINEHLSVTDIIEFFSDDHASVEMLEKLAGMKVDEKRIAGSWVVVRVA